MTESEPGERNTLEISRRRFLGTSAGAAAVSLMGTGQANAAPKPSHPSLLVGQSAEAADRDVGRCPTVRSA